MSVTRWPSANQPAPVAPSALQNVVRTAAGAQVPEMTSAPTPAQIRDTMLALTGNAALAESMYETAVRREAELGLGAAERRHVILPETNGGSDELSEDELMGRSNKRDVKQAAIRQWVRAVAFGVSPMMESVKRAVSGLTDAAGGYVVPPGFIPMIVGDKAPLSQLYQYCTKVPAPSSTATLPKIATNVTTGWNGELESADETTGSSLFGEEQFVINRLDALVKLSREWVNDANPGSVDFLIAEFGKAIIKGRDAAIAIGSGSGQPLGLYSASSIGAVSFTTLDFDAMVDLHESVGEQYFDAPGCRWTMNQTQKKRVMKIKDDNGQPIFQVDRAAGFRATIFGHGVSIDPNFPNNYIGFGDLAYYMVADRETLGVESSTETGDAFEKNAVWYKFFERWDGRPVLPPTKPLYRCRTVSG